MTENIRFLASGIKLNGEMINCLYALDQKERSIGPNVYICTKGGKHLPADILNTWNIADETIGNYSRAIITEKHPLYKYARYAAEKNRCLLAKRDLNFCERMLVQNYNPRYYEKQAEKSRRLIERYNAMQNPGQPKQKDLNLARQWKNEKENSC